jgi:4-amino-4-deoxy-L-arabinose transferase-like glycosyltransferase
MAVRSMTESWRAFVFGSADPASSITIDKIPGFLWPQAVSARIFGFHPWALALPQAIEGAVSVLVLYRVVRRWAGPVSGLLAAGIFTLTPIVAVMFGHSTMEDSALTMCLILAADACQRATLTGRTRPLLLAGMWVGLAFQAKMLQAWAVLPALAVTYAVAAPVKPWVRLRQLALAAGVTLAVSAVWILAVTLTPSADRPYVDATTDNSALAMVLGYNGLNRFGVHFPGAIQATTSTGPLPFAAHLPPPLRQLLDQIQPATQNGWGKLFGPYLATQAGWLYPLAVLAVVAGLLSRRGTPRTDRDRSGYLMWGIWLGTIGLAFSAGNVAHATYTAALAVPVAALAGVGIPLLWRTHPASLPVAVVASAGWAAYLTTRYAAFLPWLLPVLVALTVVAVALLVLARTRLAAVGLVAATAAILVVPAAWSISVLDPRYAGTTTEAAAGPVTTAGQLTLPTTLGPAQTQVLAYALAHRDGARYVFATDSWTSASPYVISTGDPVLPMGGFSGITPAPTLGAVRHLVATGQLRYVLVSGNGFSIFGLLGHSSFPPQVSATTAIDTWVQHSCTPVLNGMLYSCDPSTGNGSGSPTHHVRPWPNGSDQTSQPGHK